ncbi:hypothetical protein NPX13_g7021 [Xylaria arbuscula]|uniref:Uncharacterized protein n=1 Tax=Xylaria arbuscula TaxID=114810 RepID=A0A9W8TL66_9PEZI|nr:hypothetical protein NPX13_g7021 [Xylaria arbuscula]
MSAKACDDLVNDALQLKRSRPLLERLAYGREPSAKESVHCPACHPLDPEDGSDGKKNGLDAGTFDGLLVELGGLASPYTRVTGVLDHLDPWSPHADMPPACRPGNPAALGLGMTSFTTRDWRV